MITIALDEYGQFEKAGNNGNNGNKGKKQLVFIAGLVYDDKGHQNDAENEKARLDLFFRKVARSVGCGYPQDLHVNDADGVKFEHALETALPEFLKNGKFKGVPVHNVDREGFYRFVMMLKSERGKSKLNEKGTSDIIKDSYASNLYMNMAYSMVSRLVFHNPLDLDVKKVNFELPTRKVGVAGLTAKGKAEFQKLGHKEKETNSGAKVYHIADESNYKAAIVRKVSDLGRYDIQVHQLSVDSINYYVERWNITCQISIGKHIFL